MKMTEIKQSDLPRLTAEAREMCKHSYKVTAESTGFVMPIEWTCRKCSKVVKQNPLDGYDRDWQPHRDLNQAMELAREWKRSGEKAREVEMSIDFDDLESAIFLQEEKAKGVFYWDTVSNPDHKFLAVAICLAYLEATTGTKFEIED